MSPPTKPSLKLTREEWLQLAPSVALMSIFFLGVSVFLPIETFFGG